MWDKLFLNSLRWLDYAAGAAVFTEPGPSSFCQCAPATWNNTQNDLKLTSFLSSEQLKPLTVSSFNLQMDLF